ncbi:globin [Isoalcanivorax indicus]|uniref:globin n=1 Tax=Isoalcanivorax indicus TaxID=2202653 RepID=UPI000DBA5B37|nr:globin [Isoalcanivorax indicus]
MHSLPSADTDAVFQSYGRCCRNDRFFADFYELFMSKSEAISAVFANTDMPEQRRLLRAGVMWLIMYARGASGGKLRDLGRTHNRHGYNINPAWYGQWLDALVEAVARHDLQYSATLGDQWRRVLAPGVRLISEAY